MSAPISQQGEIPPSPFPSPSPLPPHPAPAPQMPEVHVRAPMVYVEPVWEYRHVERSLAEEDSMSEGELNELGAAGWELVGVVTSGSATHFYLKRQAR